MPRIRKFCAYRRLQRPYTRVSKFRKKAFIKASPHKVIVSFDMGHPSRKFSYKLALLSKGDLQIRQNSIESARLTCNRWLENNLGKKGYRFKIHLYPHHILRENPIAAGAGADRLSTGMKMSFGKAIGSAAQVKKGQALLSVFVNKQNLEVGKQALHRASHKMPCTCTIEVNELPKEAK